MNLLFDRELLCCPICCEEYDATPDSTPICISCGHTICKKCIDKLSTNSSMQCPIDKKKTIFIKNPMGTGLKNQIYNSSLIRVIRLYDCFKILPHKMSMVTLSYCSNCKMIISNFVQDVHETANHRILSMREYTVKNIDHLLSLANLSNSLNDEFLINLFLVDHYVNCSENINKFKSKIVNSRDTFIHHDGIFTFLGLPIKIDSLSTLTKHVLKIGFMPLIKNTTVAHGVLYTEQRVSIHGLFILDNDKHFKRGIGVIRDNTNDFLFFGMFELNKTSYPTNDFTQFIKLSYGIVYLESKCLLGHFSGNEEYPKYILTGGEDVTINQVTNSVTVIRRPIDLMVAPGSYQEDFLNNIFYQISNTKISIEKWILHSIKKAMAHYRIEYNVNTQGMISHNEDDLCGNSRIEKNNLPFVQKIFIDLYVNENTIQRSFRLDCGINCLNTNILTLLFQNTFITLFYEGIEWVTVVFQDNYQVIFSHNILATREKKRPYEGYLVQLKNEFVNENFLKENLVFQNFFYLQNLKIFSLYAYLDYFINTLSDFLEVSLPYFNITYQEFDPITNEIKENGMGIVYEIDTSTGTMIKRTGKNYSISTQRDLIKSMKLFDIFPSIHIVDRFQEMMLELNSPKMKEKEEDEKCKVGLVSTIQPKIEPQPKIKSKKAHCKCLIY